MNPILSVIKSSLLRLVLVASLLPLAERATAAEIAVRDGGSVQVVVSARELTRLSMADGSRLEKLFGADGTLDVKPDTDTGSAFIKPVNPASGTVFSFFVRDDQGATYTLVATVSDVPAQTVLLRPLARPALAKPGEASGRADPFVRRVKGLVRAMAGGAPSKDYAFENVGRVVPMWAQTETVLEQKWSAGNDLAGEVWNVRNATDDPLRLDETQFSALYPNVRAVAIGSMVLQPAAATQVFLVRGSGGEGP